VARRVREIEGLRWVVEHEQMAFSPGLSRRAAKVQPGDELILYVTRGAFHNPTRDRSQLAGTAKVTTPVQALRRPVVIAGREFTSACGLKLGVLLPERAGVPIKPLVRRLGFVKRKDVWGGYVRGGLVMLPPADLRTLSLAISGARP
jgi:hypothetical protein